MTNTQTKIIKHVKRVVIKIGSGVLTTDHRINTRFFAKLAKQVQVLNRKGLQVILVSSGAVACGMTHLKLKTKPSNISSKQAIASLGQPLLMRHYAAAFGKKGLQVAQLLLTRSDLQNPQRSLNAKHTLQELFKRHIIPIVNENDSVAVDEIQLGDNDQLSSQVAHLADAHLLLILTDIDGFYDADPKTNKNAQRIAVVNKITKKMIDQATDTLSAKSTGGMKTKLQAASYAARFDIPTWIISGHNPSTIADVFKAKNIGTVFYPQAKEKA